MPASMKGFFAGIRKAINGAGDDDTVNEGLAEAAKAMGDGDDGNEGDDQNKGPKMDDETKKRLEQVDKRLDGIAMMVFKANLPEAKLAVFEKMAPETQAKAVAGDADALKALEPAPAPAADVTKTMEDAITAAVTKATTPLLAEITALKGKVAEDSFVKRAEALKAVYPDTAELAKTLQDLPEPAAKALEDSLTKSLRVLEASPAFSEIGSASYAKAGSAYQELVAKAVDIRKGQPTLTEMQAFDKAYTDPANADIVKRHKDEQRRASAAAA